MTRRRVDASRGAITVERDNPPAIRAATIELLEAIAKENRLAVSEIVSALFTVTPDLRSDFPARASRELGWTEVPLMCMTEIAVPGALRRCIRVLLHVEFGRYREPRHLYLRRASRLRPDLATSSRR